MRGLGPKTFQARLTIALVLLIAVTLTLVSLLVVNRLDEYFTQQQQAELDFRAETVMGSVEALAASGRLTAGRFAPVFLTLRRNDHFWRTAPLPAPAHRELFGSDPAVFQYYPGRGLQLQQLATWGRVNARLGVCRAGGRCPRERLRRALDRLVALGARRDRFVAWEYYFSFGGGTPPFSRFHASPNSAWRSGASADASNSAGPRARAAGRSSDTTAPTCARWSRSPRWAVG